MIAQEEGAFDPKFKVGDFVKTKRGQFRGWIVRIEPNANKWPYTVRSTEDKDGLYAARDLEVVEGTPTFWEKMQAHRDLSTKITELKVELWALEVAQRTIEADIDEEWRKTYNFLTY